ncbi:MAG: helix-turn-helix transcriptional regulator [Bacilli bacterium]|nr:helix-turn-helix transcriptional regulator [Bacilli bacterium]
MLLSEQIASKRKSLNLSQKDLAEKLNVTDKTISRWERGTSTPDIVMLKRLSEVIDLDLNEVFSNIDTSTNNREINYETIKKFRIGYVMSTLFMLIAAILFEIIKNGNYAECDQFEKVLLVIYFVISSLMIIAGIVIYITDIVGYLSKSKVSRLRREYNREMAISVFVFSISCLCVVISLLV